MAQSDLRQPGAVLTSHVLDMTKGGPAPGVRIALSKLEDGQYHDVAESVTNADGRCDAPLLLERALPPATTACAFKSGLTSAPTQASSIRSTLTSISMTPPAIITFPWSLLLGAIRPIAARPRLGHHSKRRRIFPPLRSDRKATTSRPQHHRESVAMASRPMSSTWPKAKAPRDWRSMSVVSTRQEIRYPLADRRETTAEGRTSEWLVEAGHA